MKSTKGNINTKKNVSEKGITLLALVVTIIVLLILAGISITMLAGDNSILQKAGEAKRNTEDAQIQEQVQRAYLAALTNGTGTVDKADLEKELNNEFGTGKYQLSSDMSTVTINEVDYLTGAPSKWTADEKKAFSDNGISEMKTEEITNQNLKDTSKIKAVLTGEVPIPVGATYKEGTVDTGVVIEYKDSEFVWVPVLSLIHI